MKIARNKSLVLSFMVTYIYSFSINGEEAKPEGIVLNETRAAVTVIAPVARTLLISSLDIRPGIDGTPKTLKDIILDQIMVCESEKLPMPVPENQEEVYLNHWQQQFNIPRQEILDHFKKLGFSEDDLRVELKKRAYIDRLLDYKIRTHKDMFVNQDDIEKKWRDNPQVEEGYFTLAEAFVQSQEEPEVFKKNIQEDSAKYVFSWGEPITIYAKDLPVDKLFIGNHNPGDIVLVEQANNGFEVTKLLVKKEAGIVPLVTGDKERDDKFKNALMQEIKAERYQKILNDYQHELLEEYKPRIMFMREEDRKEIYS